MRNQYKFWHFYSNSLVSSHG